MKGRLGVTIFCLATLSSFAHAWSWQGHEITALVAQRVLLSDSSTEAKNALAALKEILGDMPIEKASSWADQVKDLARACKEAPYNSQPVCDAYRATSAWHFITTESGTYVANPADQNYNRGDLYSIIRVMAHKLAGREDSLPTPASFNTWLAQCSAKSDNPCKREALSFLIHYVGDAHQPLHTGSACDLGGNNQYIEFFGQKQVTPPPPYCKSEGRGPECANFELHALWDGGGGGMLTYKTADRSIPYETNVQYAEVIGKQNWTRSRDEKHCVTALPGAALDIGGKNFVADWLNESLCYMPQIYNFPDDGVTLRRRKGGRAVAQAIPVVPNRCRADRLTVRKVGDREFKSYSAFKVAQKYFSLNMQVVDERLYWGGHRLATLLKQIYGQGDKSSAFNKRP